MLLRFDFKLIVVNKMYLFSETFDDFMCQLSLESIVDVDNYNDSRWKLNYILTLTDKMSIYAYIYTPSAIKNDVILASE